jgi:hypothetical protein
VSIGLLEKAEACWASASRRDGLGRPKFFAAQFASISRVAFDGLILVYGGLPLRGHDLTHGISGKSLL